MTADRARAARRAGRASASGAPRTTSAGGRCGCGRSRRSPCSSRRRGRSPRTRSRGSRCRWRCSRCSGLADRVGRAAAVAALVAARRAGHALSRRRAARRGQRGPPAVLPRRTASTRRCAGSTARRPAAACWRRSTPACSCRPGRGGRRGSAPGRGRRTSTRARRPPSGCSPGAWSGAEAEALVRRSGARFLLSRLPRPRGHPRAGGPGHGAAAPVRLRDGVGGAAMTAHGAAGPVVTVRARVPGHRQRARDRGAVRARVPPRHPPAAGGGGRAVAYAVQLNIGVAIFFVISGFVLYRPFAAARAARRAAAAHAAVRGAAGAPDRARVLGRADGRRARARAVRGLHAARARHLLRLPPGLREGDDHRRDRPGMDAVHRGRRSTPRCRCGRGSCAAWAGRSCARSCSSSPPSRRRAWRGRRSCSTSCPPTRRAGCLRRCRCLPSRTTSPSAWRSRWPPWRACSVSASLVGAVAARRGGLRAPVRRRAGAGLRGAVAVAPRAARPDRRARAPARDLGRRGRPRAAAAAGGCGGSGRSPTASTCGSCR